MAWSTLEPKELYKLLGTYLDVFDAEKTPVLVIEERLSKEASMNERFVISMLDDLTNDLDVLNRLKSQAISKPMKEEIQDLVRLTTECIQFLCIVREDTSLAYYTSVKLHKSNMFCARFIVASYPKNNRIINIGKGYIEKIIF
jgi:hypothetical protein